MAKLCSIGERYGGLRFFSADIFIKRNGSVLAHAVGIKNRSDLENQIQRLLWGKPDWTGAKRITLQVEAIDSIAVALR